MRLSPFAAVIAACVLTLTACGDDGDEPSSADNSPSASESDTAEPSGKDSKDPKGGKKTESGDAAPDGSAGVCQAIDAKSVGEITGTTLKKAEPAPMSCLFTDPANPTATSFSLNETLLATIGGVDGAKSSISALGGLKPEELSDVGDQAFIGVGKGVLGTTAAAGAVIVDETAVLVNVTPDAGLSEGEIREQAVAMLELVAETL